MRTRCGSRRGPALLIAALCALAGAARASVESEVAFHRGVLAYGRGALAQAEQQFRAVLAEEPDDVGALGYLALIARGEGNLTHSIELYRAALARDADSADLQLDLAAALLEAQQTAEARALAQAVLARRPDHARARLLAGIAAYRQADYAVAIPDLERAAQLDPSLQAHARFYTALAEAFLGNATQAVSALAAVESVSHPLSDRARSLREQMRPSSERRARLDVSAGAEWDSNATLASSSSLGKQSGALGVLRARGHYDAVRRDRAGLRLGLDTYLSRHDAAHQVDLWSSVGSAAATFDLGPARLGLLYELAYAQVDLGRSFLRSHRVTPSLTFRETGLGITQIFGQLDRAGYFRPVDDPALERDGPQLSLGVDQYFFLPRRAAYLRLGARRDRLRPEGEEFRFRGYELSVAAGVRLPRRWDLTLLYRHARRAYDEHSLFAPDFRRRDGIDRVSLELAMPIRDQLTASIELSATHARSTVPVFAYRRFTVATYLSYAF